MTHTVDLVFDGRCGFCTRSVGWIERLDRRHRVTAHAAQVPGVLDRFGLDERQTSGAAWAIRDGAAVPGAAGIVLALDAALGVRIFAPMRRLPGAARVQDGIYRWIADHRHRLPGTVPWCDSHPGQCSDDLRGSSCGLEAG